MTRYHVHSWPAIVGGTLAASCAIALLTRDAIYNGLTLDHALMPFLVGLTILAGHLAWQAATEWKLSAVPMLALAVFGSGLIIYETMGRRAETRNTKIAVVADKQHQRESAMSDLVSAKQHLAQALPLRNAECIGAPDPLPPKQWPLCRKYRGLVSALETRVDSLEADVAKVAPASINPKAEQAASIASWFGISSKSTEQAVNTFDPLAFPFFLEFIAMAMFGFGIGHRKVEAPKIEAPAMTTFERPLSDAEIEELRRVLNGMRRPATNDELADAMDVSKGEASKRVQKAVEMGVVTKFRAGRFNQISLVA